MYTTDSIRAIFKPRLFDFLSLLLQPSKREPSNKAILTITYPSPDIYLVLRVEKVLQGDVDQVTEPYVKFANVSETSTFNFVTKALEYLKWQHLQVKDKEREKLKTQAKEYCSRLGQYRQPFCWAMLPLFGEDKKLMVEKNTEFKALFRQKSSDIGDSHFLETVNEYTKVIIKFSGKSKIYVEQFHEEI